LLLDVAGVRGVPYLSPGEAVTAEDLTRRRKKRSGTTLTSGDAVFVHVGLERREAELGSVEDPSVRRRGSTRAACPGCTIARWRSTSGDCVEQIPVPERSRFRCRCTRSASWRWAWSCSTARASPISSRACAELGTAEFLLSVAPLRIPGGTGSPVNPILFVLSHLF